MTHHLRVAVIPVFVVVASTFLAAAMPRAMAAEKPADDQAQSITKKLAVIHMHQHVDALLAIAVALADGRYDRAAEIANMDFGIGSEGGKRTGSAADMQDSQILWEKGLEFREAASRFAGHARIVANNKSPEAKAALFDSFTRMMSVCRDCHQNFRKK